MPLRKNPTMYPGKKAIPLTAVIPFGEGNSNEDILVRAQDSNNCFDHFNCFKKKKCDQKK